MMKVLIVEDESSSARYLRGILEEFFPQLHIEGVADNVPEAVSLIKEYRPDIIFLDVEIKMGTGFSVLAQVDGLSGFVVFTTAFNHYAVEAFRHHAVDYLLKPLVDAQVVEAVRRCMDKTAHAARLQQESVYRLVHELERPAGRSRLSIPTMDGLDFVEIRDILYAEANGNYTDLWMKDNSRVTVTRKLKAMESTLPPSQFFRIHHSYIVHFQYIVKYHKGRGGYLVLQNGISLPVAPAKKLDFLSWLG